MAFRSYNCRSAVGSGVFMQTLPGPSGNGDVGWKRTLFESRCAR